MKQEYIIYKIVHPKTNAIFYIGRTTHLKSRIRGHRSASKRPRQLINLYMKKLIEAGITPLFEVIETTTNPDRENDWIDYYLPTGKLKNTFHRKWQLKGKKNPKRLY